MTSILVVSHSKDLVQGLCALLYQISNNKVQLEGVGGIESKDTPFGSDPLMIKEALERLNTPKGTLVFCDLGSSLLSVEMALEFLNEDQKKQVKISTGPLVEGSLVAAALIASGAEFSHVWKESNQALASKQKHLDDDTTKSYHQTKDEKSISFCFKIKNKHGIHARPAAQIVKITTQYTSQIFLQSISQGIRKVDGKSINQVLSLGVASGEEVIITCVGQDSQQALDSLKELIFNNFYEEECEGETVIESEKKSRRKKPNEYYGTSLLSGCAEGSAFLVHKKNLEIPQYNVKYPFKEWKRLENALNKVKDSLAQALFQAKHLNKKERAVLEAQLLSLEDPVLLDACSQCIFIEKINAEKALAVSFKEVTSQFDQLEDVYLKERVNDLNVLLDQLIRVLLSQGVHIQPPSKESILIAEDLSPFEVAKLDPKYIRGVVLCGGSQISHSSILLRSIGIPTLIEAGKECLEIAPDTQLFLDSGKGVLTLKRNSLRTPKKAFVKKNLPVSIMANIHDIEGAHKAIAYGADGIGLLRTELLFMESLYLTPEETQYKAYSEIASLMKGLPVVIRTFDVGGDKEHPALLNENNPFLGLRGLRYSLHQIDLFKIHLKAILRACSHGTIWLSLPFVSRLEELLKVKELIDELAQEIGMKKRPPLGVLIEIPSAAIVLEHFIKYIDFVDIGSNDLTQYTLAADRTNPNVSDICNPLEPSVLLLIKKIHDICKQHKVHTSVCGEFAGNTLGFSFLSSLGVDVCSVSPHVIHTLHEEYRGIFNLDDLWKCQTKEQVLSFFRECGF
jgi:dihydroxyacetone kinase phosphotransfer subunit